jgi:erythromycin esterase-like protein
MSTTEDLTPWLATQAHRRTDTVEVLARLLFVGSWVLLHERKRRGGRFEAESIFFLTHQIEVHLQLAPSTGRSITRRAALLLGAGAVGTAALGRSNSVQIDKAAKVPPSLVETVRQHAVPLSNGPSALAGLVDMAANASFVLIGEASHGTHEFYAIRAQLTRRLIQDHGFNAVVIEANWPDTARANKYVRGEGQDKTAEEALSGFKEFPEWMWRNTDVRDFVSWLREWNAALPVSTPQTGFYGMDLYSLFSSRDAVLGYLRETDPAEAQQAAERYRRLGRFSDPHTYGAAAAFGWRTSAGRGAKQQFERMTRVAALHLRSDDAQAAERAFDAWQNSRVVRNAEEYYRENYGGLANTWNLRDRHMADTLDALAEHLRNRDGHARIVVWAHNSHIGDARATEATWHGQWNLGQLMRERHPGNAVLIGFSTNTGTVMASSGWGQPGVVKRVEPAMPRSYERAFREAGIPAFVLSLRSDPVAKELRRPLLQRAIGVIYLPRTERQSHYFEARLAQQFDAIIHLDHTRAVEPLGTRVPERADVAPQLSTRVAA